MTKANMGSLPEWQEEARRIAASITLRDAVGLPYSDEFEKWAERCADGKATPADRARLDALPRDVLDAAGLVSAQEYAVRMNQIHKAV